MTGFVPSIPPFPRDLRYLPNRFPPQLVDGRRWCCFQIVAQSGGKTRKLPIRPNVKPDRQGSHLARSDDETTWAELAACIRSADLRGLALGVVIRADEPIIVVDLDDVVSPDGVIDPLSSDLITRLDSYTELSISRHGIHVIGTGDPAMIGRRQLRLAPDREPLEIYPKGNKDRFVIPTGFIVGDFNTVRPIGAALETLLSAVPPKPRKTKAATAPLAPPAIIGLTDSEFHRLSGWAERHWLTRRHYLALYLSGALRLAGIPRDQVRTVIESAARAAGDSEVADRLRAVDDTFNAPFNSIVGLHGLKHTCGLSEAGLVTLRSVTASAAARRALLSGVSS